MYFFKKVVDFHHIWNVAMLFSLRFFPGKFSLGTFLWTQPMVTFLGALASGPLALASGPRVTITEALWALSDCTELNGATRLIPGSHLRASAWWLKGRWLDGMMAVFGWCFFCVWLVEFTRCEETNKLINKPCWLFFCWLGWKSGDRNVY